MDIVSGDGAVFTDEGDFLADSSPRRKAGDCSSCVMPTRSNARRAATAKSCCFASKLTVSDDSGDAIVHPPKKSPPQ